MEGYGHEDQGRFELSVSPMGRHLVQDGSGFFTAMEDESNMVRLNDRFFITKSPATFWEAVHVCRRKNATAAMLHEHEDYHFIMHLLHKAASPLANTGVWLGLTQVGLASG